MSTDTYGNVIAQPSGLICLQCFLHSSTKLAIPAEQPLALSVFIVLFLLQYIVYAHITLNCMEKKMIKFASCFGEVSTNSLYQYLLKKGNLFGFYYFPQLEWLYTFFYKYMQTLSLFSFFLISSTFFWLATPPKYKRFDWQAGGASVTAVRHSCLTRPYLGYPLSLITQSVQCDIQNFKRFLIWTSTANGPVYCFAALTTVFFVRVVSTVVHPITQPKLWFTVTIFTLYLRRIAL